MFVFTKDSKYNYFKNIEVKIPGKDFVSLNDLGNFNNLNGFSSFNKPSENIFNLQIETLSPFSDTLLYRIFQVCEYYNVNYNDLEIRQRITNEIKTSGEKDFEIQNKECTCFICNRKFKASRGNIIRCNSSHFCECIDLLTGEKYEKEIQKWNNLYYIDNVCYLEGKSFSSKSHQVTANNMMTLYMGTNKMQNMTSERRQEIVEEQKKRGTFALSNNPEYNKTNYNLEKKAEVNAMIARNRMKNGTHNFLLLTKEQRSENSKKIMSPKFCRKCNSVTEHFGSHCLICKPEKRFGNKPSLIKRKNILYYLDISLNKYIPWEEYKLKFKTSNIDFKLPEGFKMHSTFRTQDSGSWSGARSAFEQSLVEANIGWFVYIKFDENNKPLVVGKSGSMLVNEHSDVSFSTNINDGPSRRYLQENNLNWCKTQIAICPCETEKETYELESILLKDYNLFGS